MDQHEAAAGRRSAATATGSPTAHLFTAQQAALGELMTGMDADARWVLLLGPDGSGKSTVVRALLDELRLAAATVAVFEARETPNVDHLAGGLRDQLGLPRKRKLLGDDHSVSDIVTSHSALRTPLVVVVDDADALSSASVKWLARLASSASRTETACYVVLAGTSKLEDAAGPAWAKRGSGRASVRCILAPMTSVEVRRCVHECRISGDATVKFSEAAIQEIEMYSKGRPGLIRELCARAVTLPSTRLADQVSVDAVVETAERLGLSRATGFSAERESEIEPGSRRHVAGRVALVIGTATLAALLVYVGIRVGPRLIATSTRWVGLSVPAGDRSSSDVARSPKEEARREPGVTTGRGRGGTPSTAPSTRQGREQRSAEKTQRAIAMEPSVQQVAALMARAREGEVGELTRLVSGGVSPNVRDVGGFTPLMGAVVNDQIRAARVLLDHGAEVNARAHGGITALMLAVINDRPDAVKLLLERGAEVNAQSGAGWTALTFAVWKGDAGLVSALLSHGAKPNVADKQGWKPLDYAPPKFTPTDTGPRVEAESGSSEAVTPSPAESR
jgi:type II secretory pathway predicted ATPase ExeA